MSMSVALGAIINAAAITATRKALYYQSVNNAPMAAIWQKLADLATAAGFAGDGMVAAWAAAAPEPVDPRFPPPPGTAAR